ncbi:MAG: RidA family protein [Bacteroidota bacterium]
MQRTNIRTGAVWEDKVGYSRAVRMGNQIEVSGTVAVQNGKVVSPGDAYGQTKRILEIIKNSLEQLGGKLSDVIRTRIYVTDINVWEKVGKAHGECFIKNRPCTSMVEVRKLIGTDYLVEIEATAIVSP